MTKQAVRYGRTFY